jgi:uncharacterized protein involved in response to NO
MVATLTTETGEPGADRPRARTGLATVPLLQDGFRPFFRVAALWALLAMATWFANLAGWPLLPDGIDPLAWHRHELLFGYGSAVLVGFMLTAIPNWTGRPPVRGLPLLALVLLWAAGRVCHLGSGVLGPLPAIAVDAAFLWCGLGLALLELLAGRNWRNLPVLGLIALVAIAQTISAAGLYGLRATDLGWRLGIAGFTLLIALIGGRIVPSFTANWLKARGAGSLPPAMNRFDAACLALLALALILWLARPVDLLTGVALAAAGVAQAVRLGRWRGIATFAEPLLTVLHLGYLWLATGLLLMGLAVLGAGIAPPTAQHPLNNRPNGPNKLPVITPATLGHTGRPLAADGPTVSIFALVTAGALTRVTAPFLPIDASVALALAGVLWAAAFALFLIAYVPVLLRPHLAART